MTLPTNGYGRVNEAFRTLDTGLSYKNICLLSKRFIFDMARHCPIEPLPLCPLLFLLFVNDLPDVLETMTLIFADDVKMVTRRSQSMNFAVLLLLHGPGRRNGTYRSTLLNATIPQSGEKFP